MPPDEEPIPEQKTTSQSADAQRADAQSAETQSTEARDTDPQDTAVTSAAAAPARTITRTRLIWVDVLISVTTALLIIGMFAIYANRLLFNPDNWSKASSQLLQNPEIRSQTANYLVDQLYANVDVAGEIKNALPPRLQPLASEAAGAIRSAAVQGVELALTRPRVQALWAEANRAADQTFINVVNGGKGSVSVNNGAVTLNLGLLANNIATRLGLPESIVSKIPPNIANLTIFKSNQLKTVQNGGKLVKGLALWLTILVPVLYALAIFLATGHRRRTLMTVGFAGIFAGIVVFFVRAIMLDQIPGSLTQDASLRPAFRATIAIGTSLLAEVAGAVVFIGVILVICAFFAGPARICVAAREAMAPFLREQPGGTYAITLGILALLFIWDPIPATHTPAGIITFTVLALFGTELLRRQTLREFPEARKGAATHAVRTRLAAMGRGRRTDASAAPASSTPSTTADQLSQLAELRDSGSITAEEYATAKEQLLRG